MRVSDSFFHKVSINCNFSRAKSFDLMMDIKGIQALNGCGVPNVGPLT